MAWAVNTDTEAPLTKDIFCRARVASANPEQRQHCEDGINTLWTEKRNLTGIRTREAVEWDRCRVLMQRSDMEALSLGNSADRRDCRVWTHFWSDMERCVGRRGEWELWSFTNCVHEKLQSLDSCVINTERCVFEALVTRNCRV